MTKSRTASDSSEQQAAERYILAAVGKRFGVELEKKSIALDSDSKAMEIDGYAPDPPILCEAWAHVGTSKGAQLLKVMNDALKLMLARSVLCDPPGCRAILAFSDEDAAAPFKGNSWRAAALRRLRIEVLVVNLPRAVKASVVTAQKRQAKDMSSPQRG